MRAPVAACAALTALTLWSCASTDTLRLDGAQRQAVPAEDVELLIEKPSRPHTVIALVTVSDEGWGMSLEKLARKAREEAGKLGGNAVLLVEETTSSDGAVIIPIGNSWYASDDDNRILKAQVIVWQ